MKALAETQTNMYEPALAQSPIYRISANFNALGDYKVVPYKIAMHFPSIVNPPKATSKLKKRKVQQVYPSSQFAALTVSQGVYPATPARTAPTTSCSMPLPTVVALSVAAALIIVQLWPRVSRRK